MSEDSLVGFWVHIRKDGKIESQLKVIRKISDKEYLLQYYSWDDGSPTKSKIFSLEEMKDFDFYLTSKHMREAAQP